MTTTSVKDIGRMPGAGLLQGNTVGKTGEENFQSVWNMRAGSDKADAGQGNVYERSVRQKADVKPGDALRAKKNTKQSLDKADVAASGQSEELSREDFEKIAETVGTAMAELMQQIAETLGISEEKLQEIMNTMQLSPEDLLIQENLSNLLLEACGAENGMTLLTDEQLYADYRMLMEQGQAVQKQCCEELGIDSEKLLQEALQMLTREPDGEAKAEAIFKEEPVIEVSMRKTDDGINAEKEENGMAVQTKPAESDRNTARDEAGFAGENAGQSAEGEHANPVLQTLQNENTNLTDVKMQTPESTWSSQTQDIMRQIMDYMRIQVEPDVSSLEMQLHPASLGKLQIHIASEGGVLTANFVTESETVKAALESQMVQFKENFAQQGVKVEAVEVTVQTHEFERNLEQDNEGQSRKEDSRSPRVRTRRIRLNGPDGLEESEMQADYAQEDRLTAEMMAANGQTVDFTA